MKNINKYISFLVVAAMLVGCIPLAQATEAYTDVPSNAWYAECASYCMDNNILIGTADGIFSPKVSLTRAMFVTALYRLAGSPSLNRVAAERGAHFQDIDEESYYYTPLIWAVWFDIVEGTGNGNFSPNRPITREQIACMIMRYLRAINFELDDPVSNAPYADYDAVSEYAKECVKEICDTGLMIGDDKQMFHPQNKTSRAEAAMVLMRLNEELDKPRDNKFEDCDSGKVWVLTAEDAQTIQAILDKDTFDKTGMPEFPAAYILSLNNKRYYFESLDFYEYNYHLIAFNGKEGYGGLSAHDDEAVSDMKEIYAILNRYISLD